MEMNVEEAQRFAMYISQRKTPYYPQSLNRPSLRCQAHDRICAFYKLGKCGAPKEYPCSYKPKVDKP